MDKIGCLTIKLIRCRWFNVRCKFGVNPSLTITALAERAMSYIPAKHTLEEQAYTQTHNEVLEAAKVSA